VALDTRAVNSQHCGMSRKIHGRQLDRTFAALADPTRRASLARPAKRPGARFL
jgi:hypothetical protein